MKILEVFVFLFLLQQLQLIQGSDGNERKVVFNYLHFSTIGLNDMVGIKGSDPLTHWWGSLIENLNRLSSYSVLYGLCPNFTLIGVDLILIHSYLI